MDEPWRPIRRAAVTNSPNTEAVLLCLLVWLLGSVMSGPWPRPPVAPPTRGPAHRTAALILWLLPGPISASLVLSLGRAGTAGGMCLWASFAGRVSLSPYCPLAATQACVHTSPLQALRPGGKGLVW